MEPELWSRNLRSANGKEEIALRGQKEKPRPRKAVNERKGKTGAKKRTSRASSKTRSGAGAGAAGVRKRVRRGTAKGRVRKSVAKVGTARGSRKRRTQLSQAIPPVEKVKEEARVLEARGSGWVEPESQFKLPDSYGRDLVVAMPRDPYWIYVYWEITEGTLSHALRSLGRAQLNARRILRVYTRDGERAGVERALFDIFLTPEARNWYINVGGPGRTYRVDIGLLTAKGKFVCLVSSNVVSTPRDRMSDVLDEKWMSLSPEYEEMYALSGGLTRGVSSPELHERLARELEVRLASPLFSPGMREIPGKKKVAKPFWLTIDTDLIVYGATVPGSVLTINGENWRLRDDGTFSFRCHLSEGTREIDVSASSSEGAGKEHVELKVNRVTRQTRE